MSKYHQIIEFIEKEIESGKILPGKKLPSIRDICKIFNCSKSTAVRAYSELEKNHIAYSIPQSGYYLAERRQYTENKNGLKIADLSSASPDITLLPYEEFQHCLNQAIDVYKEILFSYTEPQGLKPLIDILEKHLQDHQVFANPEMIFVTSGSQQALDILTKMPFPNGKDNIVVEQPTYQGILMAAEINKIKVIGVARDFKSINFDHLERIFKNGNVKFFYTISRFSNPLGLSYTKEEKKHILALAEKYDVYIVEDDYLCDMETDPKADPIFAYDTSSRVIYIESYSKTLLPGLRLAVAVLPKLLINTFKEYKKWADLNTSVLSQGALEIYIKSGMFNSHIKKIKKLYSDRMKFLKKLVDDINSDAVKWHIPHCGLFAGIEILNGAKAQNIAESLRRKNIMISNPNQFYLKEFQDSRFLRISIARSDEKTLRTVIPEIIKEISGATKEIRNIMEL